MQIDGCYSYKYRTFILYSNFLPNNGTGKKQINCEYTATEKCCVNYIYCAFSAQMNSNINTHPVSKSGVPEIIYPSFNMNNVVYTNVLCLQNGALKTYHAPQVGTIKYIYYQDTFNLINYKIN